MNYLNNLKYKITNKILRIIIVVLFFNFIMYLGSFGLNYFYDEPSPIDIVSCDLSGDEPSPAYASYRKNCSNDHLWYQEEGSVYGHRYQKIEKGYCISDYPCVKAFKSIHGQYESYFKIIIGIAIFLSIVLILFFVEDWRSRLFCVFYMVAITFFSITSPDLGARISFRGDFNDVTLLTHLFWWQFIVVSLASWAMYLYYRVQKNKRFLAAKILYAIFLFLVGAIIIFILHNAFSPDIGGRSLI